VIENVKILKILYYFPKVIYINRILHCNIAMYWDLQMIKKSVAYLNILWILLSSIRLVEYYFIIMTK